VKGSPNPPFVCDLLNSQCEKQKLTLARFWGVGEEKYARMEQGGFHEQTATDLHQRVQATSCESF
jgi:hypothetical protein